MIVWCLCTSSCQYIWVHMSKNRCIYTTSIKVFVIHTQSHIWRYGFKLLMLCWSFQFELMSVRLSSVQSFVFVHFIWARTRRLVRFLSNFICFVFCFFAFSYLLTYLYYILNKYFVLLLLFCYCCCCCCWGKWSMNNSMEVRIELKGISFDTRTLPTTSNGMCMWPNTARVRPIVRPFPKQFPRTWTIVGTRVAISVPVTPEWRTGYRTGLSFWCDTILKTSLAAPTNRCRVPPTEALTGISIVIIRFDSVLVQTQHSVLWVRVKNRIEELPSTSARTLRTLHVSHKNKRHQRHSHHPLPTTILRVIRKFFNLSNDKVLIVDSGFTTFVSGMNTQQTHDQQIRNRLYIGFATHNAHSKSGYTYMGIVSAKRKPQSEISPTSVEFWLNQIKKRF